LIARQMGKACVVSCAGLVVDAAARRAEIGPVALVEGDWISTDGDTGEVFLGQREIVTERPEAMLAEIDSWREDAARHQDIGGIRVAD
jgi:pyruvate,orthophosphate dikinase